MIDSKLKLREGSEFCIPRTIVRIERGKPVAVPCINLSDNDLLFERKVVYTRAWPCIEQTEVEEVLKLSETKKVDLPLNEIQIGPVNEQQKEKLFQLLNEYRDCFAQSQEELGCAKSAHMKIQLNDEKPFTYRPYKMSRFEQETVGNMVKELLENNIIRDSDSDYCSPVLLIKKKNGENRLCIDYRKLNYLTIKENYPLPRIDDQVDRLQGGIYFSSLDMRSGYYQVPLEEDSKRYTSFITSEGQYEFNRFPFGLTNAPRIFQRLLNKILRPARKFAAVYLDDVLLYGQNIEEALNNLRDALNIFRSEGLTLNLKKCSFLMTSITYLG